MSWDRDSKTITENDTCILRLERQTVSFIYCLSLSPEFLPGLLRDYTGSWLNALRLSAAVCELGVFSLSLDSLVKLIKALSRK